MIYLRKNVRGLNMKILSIGNSFSDDAHAYLYDLAKQRNIDLKLVNLVIGGCSLQRHWENIESNKADYGLCINGKEWAEERVSANDTIKSQEFDIVTIQQVSHFSGMYETYQPYLDNLAAFVRENQPKAQLYFQKTWAYEIDSDHSEFYLYDKDQRKMYDALCKATDIASGAVNAKLIKSGDVIQTMREKLPFFDYKNGGESLCRDGFHMSLTYGRFAVALTWLTTLTGKKAEPLPFMELDNGIIAQICNIINETVF